MEQCSWRRTSFQVCIEKACLYLGHCTYSLIILLFSFDVVDESGEIRVTAFKEQCDKFQPMIEIGKVYYITGGTLKAANKQYSTLNNDYEMTLKDSSEISPCTDAAETSSIPTLSFNFAKIGSLDASLKDR